MLMITVSLVVLWLFCGFLGGVSYALDIRKYKGYLDLLDLFQGIFFSIALGPLFLFIAVMVYFSDRKFFVEEGTEKKLLNECPCKKCNCKK